MDGFFLRCWRPALRPGGAAICASALLLTCGVARAQPRPPEATALVPPDVLSNERIFELDRGTSIEAVYFGLASIAVVLGGALAATLAAEPGAHHGNTLAAVDLLYAGLAIPLVASGGASARGHPYVTGAPTARALGWLGWALSLAGGVALLALDLDQRSELSPLLFAPAALASTSLLLFTFDAVISAFQVDLLRR